MNFKSLYNSTSDETKLKFLVAILIQNQELQNQFAKYVETGDDSNKNLSFQEFCEEVEDTKALYLDFFGEIDTENPDFDNYIPTYSGYMKDWEVYQEASEQEVGGVFEHFKKKALETIISHQPDKSLAMLIGLLQATNEAEVEDPVEALGDVNEYLQVEFQSTCKSIVEKVRMAPFVESIIFSAWSLFFKYCDKEYFKDAAVPVRYFEDLLLTLAEKCNSSEELLTIHDQSKIKREDLPQLTLLLMKKGGNSEGWLNSALQNYRQDSEVARQLLEYYHENDLVSFKKLSRELFNKDRRTWTEFLKDFITPEMDKSLYVDVFYQLIIDEANIEYYKGIREFLSENAKNNLMKEVKWRKPFVAQILEIEERFEDIKMLAEAADPWDFPHIIEPILKIYPEFCFNELSRRVWKMLENRRGRSTYHTIANWLKLSQSIPGFFNEKKEMISRLYHHKPNLPALKGELRKAGLVN